MSKIIDAVSVVLTCGEEIFAIQRQNFLKAFPGYWAFPGGKVEKGDEVFFLEHALTAKIDPRLFGAVVRESQEELGTDLRTEALNGNIHSIDFLGLAVTPDFNPFRFATYFFKINLKKKPTFKVDRNEAAIAEWTSTHELLGLFNEGKVLAVPPVIKVIETLGRDFKVAHIPDLNFDFDSSKYVPYIESLRSVRQIMPRSHTLPPATRTNAFLIGDGDAPKVLIDPSPIDDDEYEKFKNTIALFGVDKIMLTHHHLDHHERALKLALELGVPVLLSKDTHQRLTRYTPSYFEGAEVHFLKEGDTLTNWLGREVKIFEVPGHDEGQLAVAPVDLSWFLAGDLFQGIGTVVIGGDEGDMSKYFKTLERIILLNPKVVFPSHGIGLGGVSILERTLEHRRTRENQVLTLHKEGMGEKEILTEIYSQLQADLLPLALENIRKHLQKLRLEGKI